MERYPRTAAEVRAEAVRLGYRLEVLGSLPLGEELVAIRTGGERLRPIMVTAGSHADEVAGVLAGLRMLREPRTEHAIHFIPLRDPLGWNGFTWCLDRVLGKETGVRDHRAAAAVLRREAEVLVDDPVGGMVLAIVGDIAFATMPEEPYLSYQLCRRLLGPLLVGRGELRGRLAGHRIILPGNRAYAEGISHYECGGHTAYVGRDGWVGHFNRFFDREDAPPEVALVRAFMDRVKPGFSVDLHEGFSNKYYVFTPPLETPLERAIGDAMINAVAQRGYPISSTAELAALWGPTAQHIREVGRGQYTMASGVQETGPSFNWYCRKYGTAFTTEPGMENPIDLRTDFVEWSARAAIATYEAWGADQSLKK